MADRFQRNIILIGYHCSGKTAVGKVLAEKLQVPFCDTDALISRRTGKSVRQIVAEQGWEGFRREERIVIKGLSFMKGSVIALGGGAVMNPENLEILNGKGVFVWLAADAATIVARIQQDAAKDSQRPLLTNTDAEAEMETLLKEREPIYRMIADKTVDTTDRAIEAIADEIFMLMTGG